MLPEKFYVSKSSPCCGKPCGSFDKICSCTGYGFTQFLFLFFCQQTGFHYYFQNFPLTGFFQNSNFLFHQIKPPVFYPAQIDDHIKFTGSVGNGVSDFKFFYSRGIITIGKTNDGADFHSVSQIFPRLLHIRRRNADGSSAIFQCVLTNLLNFLPGGCLI